MALNIVFKTSPSIDRDSSKIFQIYFHLYVGPDCAMQLTSYSFDLEMTVQYLETNV